MNGTLWKSTAVLLLLLKKSKIKAMAYKYDDNVRPLNSLTDQELLEIVGLYAVHPLSVNSLAIVSVETQYQENPDDASLSFRITAEHHDTRKKKAVFGFVLEFWSEDFDNLRFTPYNKLTYKTEYLKSWGITHDFAVFRQSINSVYQLFHDKLKIWNKGPEHSLEIVTTVEEWHPVQGVETLDKY